jgi:hypothetical protein
MNAIPDSDLEGYGTEKRLERLLYSLKGDAMPAVNVMEAIGIPFYLVEDTKKEWAVIPHTAFIDFHFLLRRVSGFFADHGFAVRFGGRPLSNVWIEQVRSS